MPVTRYEFLDEDLAQQWLQQALVTDKQALAKQVGIPQLARIDARGLPASGERLSHVVAKWKQHKTAGVGGRVTRHIQDGERLWREFIRQVSNILEPIPQPLPEPVSPRDLGQLTGL